MPHFDLYEYYKQYSNNNIILAFKGALSQEILVEMGAFIKYKIGLDKKIKRIFSVFVELSQNIMHYSAEREFVERDKKEIGVGIIVFTEDKNDFFVISGNLINKASKENLIKRFEEIRGLDADQLKKLYSEKRRQPPEEGSKGAGLGIIEIARKSNNQLSYSITDVDDDSAFLKVIVKIEKGE